MIPEIRWPLYSNTIKRGVMGTFGMVRKNGAKAHQGWDLYAEVNTPCYAVGNGKVRRVEYTSIDNDQGGLGKLVIIELDDTVSGYHLFATYAHLSSILINAGVGSAVRKGQLIAYTGSTGNAAGMTGVHVHLHFEFRTALWPGTHLANRIDPAVVYGPPPLNTVETDISGECASESFVRAFSGLNPFPG